jgi:hypothetical protein
VMLGTAVKIEAPQKGGQKAHFGDSVQTPEGRGATF